MSTLIYLLSQKQQKQGVLARLARRISQCSEAFWLVTSLLLFMILGPFSAVIVVIALFSLAGEKHVKEMSEPATHREVKGEMSA